MTTRFACGSAASFRSMVAEFISNVERCKRCKRAENVWIHEIEQLQEGIMEIPAVADAVRSTFGVRSLTEKQEDAVRASLEGRDVIVLLPTGAGKSFCFQVPAVVEAGVTVVVGPLLSLATDRLRQLRAQGVACESDTGNIEFSQRMKALKDDSLKILYTTPEQVRRDLRRSTSGCSGTPDVLLQ